MCTIANSDSSCCADNNLSRFLTKLHAQGDEASLKDRMTLIEGHPIHLLDVLGFARSNRQTYCRSIVESNDLFQVLVLVWLPGQVSPIHNHRDSQCVVRVVSGNASEIVYVQNSDQTYTCKSATYRVGAVFGGEDDDIHSLGNLESSTETLVTLHTYFPPLSQMDLFKVDGELLVKELPSQG